MLVGRINKQPLQISRFTVNFSEYFDTGETIAALSDQNIKIIGSGYQGPWPNNPYAFNPLTQQQLAQLVAQDQNPLHLVGSYVILSGVYAQAFVTGGTIGLVYQVQFVATGTSTRAIPIEVLVQVNPPS